MLTKQLEDYGKRFEKLLVQEMPKEYQVNKSHSPDGWLAPEIAEVAVDEITISSTHTAGKV